jgi:pseudaminic acid cytidylyltransferase
MKNICIIPARGDSKRIPRKNLKSFLNKPIISYSIEAALESELFDEIMVSTDDLEIAKISELHGAKIPFMRSEEASNDYATIIDVLLEVIRRYKLEGKEFDNICCIFPCAPFVNKERLIESYQLMIKDNFDSVFPVVKYSTPIQRAFKIVDNKVEMFFSEYKEIRSQDLDSSYYDAGQFYWLKCHKMIVNKSIFSDNSGSIILNELSAQDIDNESDWNIAEIKFLKLK